MLPIQMEQQCNMMFIRFMKSEMKDGCANGTKVWDFNGQKSKSFVALKSHTNDGVQFTVTNKCINLTIHILFTFRIYFSIFYEFSTVKSLCHKVQGFENDF